MEAMVYLRLTATAEIDYMSPMQATMNQEDTFPIIRNRLVAGTFVFVAYFLGAKLGLYLYFAFHTSPALIWPPVGIGIAAVIFGGYEMCLPIFLAQALSLVIPGHAIDYSAAFFVSVAYALQAAAILYCLRRFRFGLSFDTLRDVLVFIGVALVLTSIEPILGTLVQSHSGALGVSFVYNVARVWGGGVFSALVFAPFILVWSQARSFLVLPVLKKRIEIIAAFVVLAAMNYFLFWTSYPPIFGISVIFFLPAILIWFALSLYPRWMTLALFLTAIEGLWGSLYSQASLSTPLNVQLISDEVYIGLVAAIFLVFVAVVQERRAAYLRLETEYQSASAADKAKSDFIAILAHELRNPLAPIVSALEWLRLQPQTQETSAIVLSAQEHAGMLRRLLDDLLDTARLSQRKLKLKKENARIRTVIEQSIVSVQEMIRRRSQDLSVSLPSEEIIVYADPVRLKQIIINLLANASKYSKNGGRIRLAVERASSEVVIRVIDNGIGIIGDALLHIFEPFKQGGSSDRHDSGLGIGLFLAKNLAEMHGGRIDVASEGLGRGSTFSLFLPLSTRNIAEDTLPISPASVDTQAHRILVVDDNEAAAQALARLLLHYGHTVETAYSGARVLDLLESFRPQVVLLDIAMPGMDGYAVARALRSLNREMTLIALSGYGQESDKQQSKEAGFDYHLVKPINVEEIFAVLRTHAEAQR